MEGTGQAPALQRPDGPRRPFSPNAQLCRELRSLHRNAASGLRALPAEVAGDQGCQGAPGAGAKELREQAGGALMGAAPVLCSAPAEAPEHCPQVAGCRRCEAARKAPRIQPSATTCSAEGTLPSIAATADARRSSSRQSRAIAGLRPPGRAGAKAGARGGRRVPRRRCAPRRWLLRILSRSSWDRTPPSAAWAWAVVCARGAVRARVDVGVHVCVCVYGRGGCVRACVCEREDEGVLAGESARVRVRPAVTLRATAKPTRGQSRPD